MLKLNNKPLPYDKAFTHDGIQYPSNWLRLSSLDQRNAIGITEVADDPWYDQRFYWGVDKPKDLDQLKTLWSDTQSEMAGTLLAPSDLRVIKAKETGTNIPSTWKTYRADVRAACNTRQAEIAAASDVPTLRNLFFANPTITQQKKDSDGNGVVDADNNPVMETIANPALATDWPTPI